MSVETMHIPTKDLLKSLEEGYKEYKKAMESGHDDEDLGHIKGFCTTLEQILAAYGKVTLTEMMEIKRPIIGSISLRRKKPKEDYDIPTFIRKKSSVDDAE
ncbi:hypothetical protein [Sulfurimonas paralvinellae]|uniref:Uncharacterized protein n=1 Tax=Sulfurimonas paralvinellae TaxID=317658 RepID=A0A7M1BAW3_9BACT|nr:hypothetical protein [Sulfurimonas paralvinellae]QOP46771.1 hypothetical protein FM071_10370 [Sulfurimonas paralvinellae]